MSEPSPRGGPSAGASVATTPRPVSTSQPRTAGRLPALAVTTTVGLALVSGADSLSRSGSESLAQPIFWAGLVMIFAPAAWRLLSAAPSRSERLAIVLLAGSALYVVKVLRDPYGFTYADELVHQYNAVHIVQSGALFGRNPILPVTPSYPGLEGLTGALTALTGLSTFAAGLVVIGVARLLMSLALVLLFESLTDDTRIAAIAALLYSATPNYLFFDAQFSYESLALPLAIMAVWAALRWDRCGLPDRWPWILALMVLLSAVAVTHHMTSYGLVAFLLAVTLVTSLRGRASGRRLLLATVLAGTVVGSWLFEVASNTVGYLSPVITKAISATFGTVAHEQAPRALFSSTSGNRTPRWEQILAVGAAALTLIAQPAGIARLWKRQEFRAAIAVLVAASIAYIGSYGLRFVPAAWETGARASEFLFVGGALVVGAGLLAMIGRIPAAIPARSAMAAVATVIFVGGVISGSPSGLRTAQPYRVSVGGLAISPPGTAAADWLRSHLGGSTPIAAQEADARLILVYGDRNVVAGTYPDIRDVLTTPTLYRWQLELLAQLHVRYVLIDARKASANVSTGYYFPNGSAVSADRFPEATLAKFERAGASRVFDSGDILIDDISTAKVSAASP